MQELKLKNVIIVLVEQRIQVRSGLRGALNDAGLLNTNIIDGPDLNTVFAAMQRPNPPDVVICDAASPGGDVIEAFHAIRHNKIGTNPFVAIIAVSWEPTAATVDRVANSGADFILAAPFSPQLLLDRITLLVYNPVPYVVTSEYVGPDRRYKYREQSKIPLVQVPNSLRDKATGNYNAKKFRAQIFTTMSDINEQKMERHAMALATHSEVLVQQFETGRNAVDLNRLEKLEIAATDLQQRSRKAGLQHIAKLCDALLNVINKIFEGDKKTPVKEFELMQQLALAIRKSFAVNHREVGLLHDVAQTVSSRG